jgi:hypothetical protein
MTANPVMDHLVASHADASSDFYGADQHVDIEAATHSTTVNPSAMYITDCLRTTIRSLMSAAQPFV